MILFQSLHVQQQAALSLREALGAGSQWEGASAITHRGHLFDLDPEDGPGAWTISTLLNSTDPIAV